MISSGWIIQPGKPDISLVFQIPAQKVFWVGLLGRNTSSQGVWKYRHPTIRSDVLNGAFGLRALRQRLNTSKRMSRLTLITLPKTNSSPLNIGLSKRKGSSSNHPFSGAMAVSFREGTSLGCGWPPKMPVASEGLVRDPRAYKWNHPCGQCYWEGAAPNISLILYCIFV